MVCELITETAVEAKVTGEDHFSVNPNFDMEE